MPRAASSAVPASLLHPRQGFNREITPNFRQDYALTKATVAIELEQFHGGLADHAYWVAAETIQQKAAGPAVGAWMEEPEELGRLTDERAEVTPFGAIAASASPRKVACLRLATVLAADDVIHLTTPEGIVLVDEAVLADVIGALGDLLAHPLAQVSSHEPGVGGRGLWNCSQSLLPQPGASHPRAPARPESLLAQRGFCPMRRSKRKLSARSQAFRATGHRPRLRSTRQMQITRSEAITLPHKSSPLPLHSGLSTFLLLLAARYPCPPGIRMASQIHDA